jgi:hypothetical protein
MVSLVAKGKPRQRAFRMLPKLQSIRRRFEAGKWASRLGNAARYTAGAPAAPVANADVLRITSYDYSCCSLMLPIPPLTERWIVLGDLP